MKIYRDDEEIPGDDESFRMPVDENGDLCLPRDNDDEVIRIMSIFVRRMKKHKDVFQFTDEQISDQEDALMRFIEKVKEHRAAEERARIADLEAEIAGRELDEELRKYDGQQQFPSSALRKYKKYDSQ